MAPISARTGPWRLLGKSPPRDPLLADHRSDKVRRGEARDLQAVGPVVKVRSLIGTIAWCSGTHEDRDFPSGCLKNEMRVLRSLKMAEAYFFERASSRRNRPHQARVSGKSALQKLRGGLAVICPVGPLQYYQIHVVIVSRRKREALFHLMDVKQTSRDENHQNGGSECGESQRRESKHPLPPRHKFHPCNHTVNHRRGIRLVFQHGFPQAGVDPPIGGHLCGAGLAGCQMVFNRYGFTFIALACQVSRGHILELVTIHNPSSPESRTG